MNSQMVQDELRVFIQDFFKAQNIDLIEMVFRFQGKELHINILIDKFEGRISIGECASINRELCLLLDDKKMLEDGYVIEVSSPGLDRPMITEKDFLRGINRKVRVFCMEAVEGKWEHEGVIKKFEEGKVYIETAGAVFAIPLSKITKAKPIVI